MDRYSEIEFPAYTYVPGHSLHPRREAGGHSYGEPEPHLDSFSAVDWQSSDAFLFGIDLFNAGYFWEAHEQWEAIWHAVGRTGPLADFFKGLIKLAAAGVKHMEGRAEGVERHLNRATQLFESVKPHYTSICGLDIDELSQAKHRVDLADKRSIGLLLQPIESDDR